MPGGHISSPSAPPLLLRRRRHQPGCLRHVVRANREGGGRSLHRRRNGFAASTVGAAPASNKGEHGALCAGRTRSSRMCPRKSSRYILLPAHEDCLPCRRRPLQAQRHGPQMQATWYNMISVTAYQNLSGIAKYLPTIQRLAQLPSVYTSGRRHASNWAWTPWEPQRPKHSPTSPQELDGILKRLSEIELSHEEEVKFKTAFFKRFYSENIEDPKTVDMKLDLIMHKLDDLREEILQSRRKKKSEWGTFMIFGRKIDLSKVVAFLGFWF